jgi:hypothetical protein
MTIRTSSVLFVTLSAIATVCAQAQTAAGIRDEYSIGVEGVSL